MTTYLVKKSLMSDILNLISQDLKYTFQTLDQIGNGHLSINTHTMILRLKSGNVITKVLYRTKVRTLVTLVLKSRIRIWKSIEL